MIEGEKYVFTYKELYTKGSIRFKCLVKFRYNSLFKYVYIIKQIYSGVKKIILQMNYCLSGQNLASLSPY